MTKKLFIAGAVVALAAAAHAAAPKPEAAAVKADSALSAAVANVRETLAKSWNKKKPQTQPGGCLPGTHPSQEGENGIVCRSDNPSSVTCEILGYKDVVDGEMGVIRKPILGKCTPEGGWAGSKPLPGSDAQQAP